MSPRIHVDPPKSPSNPSTPHNKDVALRALKEMKREARALKVSTVQRLSILFEGKLYMLLVIFYKRNKQKSR